MTTEQQIQAIQTFSYGEPEAQFLRLVALHSGYFLRRQFLRSADRRKGKYDQDFFDKLIVRGHGCREVFRQDRHLFRLQSKTVYEALGAENNRNRREHQPSTIRLRLMGLDFILEHHEHRYLLTEQEKVFYFSQQCGIEPQVLPARSIRANGTLMTRYFPDGFPQFLDPGNPAGASFVYIEDEQLSVGTLRSYIGQYRGLFQALRHAGLVFVTRHHWRFEAARNILQQHCDLNLNFTSCVLEHDYDLFGTLCARDGSSRATSVVVASLQEIKP
jgi:hypothetical protein